MVAGGRSTLPDLARNNCGVGLRLSSTQSELSHLDYGWSRAIKTNSSELSILFRPILCRCSRTGALHSTLPAFMSDRGMPHNPNSLAKRLDKLATRIEKVERRMDQMGDSLKVADSFAKRSAITFRISRRWNIHEMARFLQAVSTLYGISLVHAVADGDDDCERLLLNCRWERSADIVLTYCKLIDPHYKDGSLVIETVDLRSRGMISLKGWTEPIDWLHDLLTKVSRQATTKSKTKASQQRLPLRNSLKKPERGRLLATVQSCLAELEGLGAGVC